MPGLPGGFEVGVLEDEGLAADGVEIDDGAGVLAHVDDLGDPAQAELEVADELAAAELGRRLREELLTEGVHETVARRGGDDRTSCHGMIRNPRRTPAVRG